MFCLALSLVSHAVTSYHHTFLLVWATIFITPLVLLASRCLSSLSSSHLYVASVNKRLYVSERNAETIMTTCKHVVAWPSSTLCARCMSFRVYADRHILTYILKA
jgi:hypothetical protein